MSWREFFGAGQIEAAAEALGRELDEGDASFPDLDLLCLRKLVAHPDTRLRQQALRALGRAGDLHSIAALATVFDRALDFFDHDFIFEAFKDMGEPAVPELTRIADVGTPGERCAAADSKSHYREAVSNPSRAVRPADLAGCWNSLSGEDLLPLATDPSPTVRLELAHFRRGREPVFKVLCQDPSPAVRAAAVSKLKTGSPEQILPILEHLVQDRSPKVRRKAAAVDPFVGLEHRLLTDRWKKVTVSDRLREAATPLARRLLREWKRRGGKRGEA